MEPGDPGAFCQEIRGRLVGTLTLYCSDREVAEELAQEALTRTWQRWARVGRMDAPEAYTTRSLQYRVSVPTRRPRISWQNAPGSPGSIRERNARRPRSV